MAPPLDPYRTLGLSPGAPIDEIRRAYRRLAKANHPDSAGEAALPRFLAIQAAYEMLVAGHGRATRSPGRSTRTSTNPGPTPRADPGRAGATRDAYGRTRRAGASAGAGRTGATDGGPRPSGAPGSRPGAADRSAPGGTGGSSTGERPKSGSGRGSHKKATLGSTSYDAAEDEPFEPEWAGGSWYGAGSGTYWTLNPKEYADPRKHGPEYQRRARRRLDGLEPEDPDADASFSGDDFESRSSETDAGSPGRQEFDGRWAYPDDAAEDRADWREDPGVVWTRWSPDVQRARPTLDEIADRILDGRIGFGARLVVAFLGWVPIAALIAWLAGELSGCGRYTASCSDPSGIWTLIPLFVVYMALVLVPRAAGLSAAGLLGSLALAVPAAVILSAGGGSRQPDASVAVLNVLFVVGYLVGVVLATARKLGWRRVPSA
jgi:curved DNA-binding protein CbpA